MTGFRIEGNTSGNVAEVDSNNNLQVNLPTVNSQAGLAGVGSIVWDGSSGAPRLVRAADVSYNRRLRVGIDNLFFDDSFNYSAQNTGIWYGAVTTWANSWTGGFWKMTSTVATGNCFAKTYKMFPIYNGAGLGININALWVQPLQTGEVIELGAFQAAAGTAIPTDGVFFRYTSGGALNGIVNYNGTETSILLTPTPVNGVTHSHYMRIEQEQVEFWVDGALLGVLPTPSAQSGPCQSSWQPICFRMYAAGATSTIQVLQVGEVRAYVRDINAQRPWAQAMAGLGGMGSQGQGGGTMGTTAVMVNGAGSALVATTAIANGTVASGVFLGLGGNVAIQPWMAANTDAWLFDYLVPVGSATVPGKSLVITGVKITGVVTAAFTGGPLLAVYSLAYGGYSAGGLLALTQAEAAGTKAFSRVPLGIESYAASAAVGVMGQGVSMQFLSPIIVAPGENVGIAIKNIGTALSAGAVTYTATFDAHWE